MAFKKQEKIHEQSSRTGSVVKHGDSVTVKTGVTLTLSLSYQSISSQVGMEKTVGAAHEESEFKRQFDRLDEEIGSRADDMKSILLSVQQWKHKNEGNA